MRGRQCGTRGVRLARCGSAGGRGDFGRALPRGERTGALRWPRIGLAPLMKTPLPHCTLPPTPLSRTRHHDVAALSGAPTTGSATARQLPAPPRPQPGRSVSSRACIGDGGSTVPSFHGRGSAISGPAPPTSPLAAGRLDARNDESGTRQSTRHVSRSVVPPCPRRRRRLQTFRAVSARAVGRPAGPAARPQPAGAPGPPGAPGARP